MLKTDKGQIAGRPETSMVKREGVWKHLLVCRVDATLSDEELQQLFNTESVEDDAIQIKWHYTVWDSLQSAGAYKYAWLTYTAETSTRPTDTELEEALHLLGVQTQMEGGEA